MSCREPGHRGSPSTRSTRCEMRSKSAPSHRVDGPLAEDCRAIGPLCIIPQWLPGRIWQRAYGRFERGRWIRGLRRWAPDLIYINSVAALPIAQWVPLPDVPTILHVHELHIELMQVMKKCPDVMVSRPTRYLAASEAVLRALVCECGINEDRIAVVHEFVPERRINGVSNDRGATTR